MKAMKQNVQNVSLNLSKLLVWYLVVIAIINQF